MKHPIIASVLGSPVLVMVGLNAGRSAETIALHLAVFVTFCFAAAFVIGVTE